MREPLENEYFNWLCAKVTEGYGNTYIGLFRILYTTPFVWFVPGDKNRAEDGCELRMDFFREIQMPVDYSWLEEPCSVFEMLVAFSRIAAFQTDIPNREWFVTFLTNLGLIEYRRVSESDKPIIEGILNTFLYRIYDPSGWGGMFPLRMPREDQRHVEIWYQFCAWVDEQGLV